MKKFSLILKEIEDKLSEDEEHFNDKDLLINKKLIFMTIKIT